MKKGKFKSLLIVVFIIITILFAYNLFRIFTTNKQILEILTSNQISSNGNVEAIVKITDKKTSKAIKSKLTIELKDDDNRKVKHFKKVYDIEEGKANISIPLPQNIQPGRYTLLFTSNSGLKKEVEELNLTISDKNAGNAVISLDKGIYKPGDDVNFRVLLLTKNNNEPISDEAEISIYDANNNRVYINRARTSEFGIISGKFTLADQVNSGDYKITVSTKTVKESKTFTVNPYVTPTFGVNVETAQDKYEIGDTASFSIKANYFFGEPVANATVKGTIGDTEISGLTNAEGIFEYSHKIDKAGKYDLNVQVTDTSNYLVEASKSIYGSTDIFEIDVIPENGNIIKGISNKVYLISKSIDGTPVKTNMEIRFNNVFRQVVTDEAGIGILNLSADDVNLLEDEYNGYVIDINATDMNGNLVTKSTTLDVIIYSGIVVNSEKVKYKQNEDITLELNSTTDVGNRDVYIFKNKDLLKIISTDLDEVTFNLEDTYGLIDIYTKTQFDYIPTNIAISTNDYYDGNYKSYSGYIKKTIFIAPEKNLDIGITTNKAEYAPGEKLNIEFTTKNNDGQNTDAGLLVSILDEAVLSLADNDLSIDSIKLALEDIELTEGITLADLYAEILDGSNENKLRVALLKQSNKTPNISQVISDRYYNERQEDYIFRTIIFGIIFGIVVIGTLMKKYPKFKSGILVLLNLVVIFAILYLSFYDLLYYELYLSEIGTAIVVGVTTLILYSLVLYKYMYKIFEAILKLVIIPLAAFLPLAIAYDATYNELILIGGALLPAIIMTILIVISRKHNLNRFWNFIKEISIILFKAEIIYALTALLTSMFDIDLPVVGIAIVLILYCISEKIYGQNQKTKIVDGKVVFEVNTSLVIGFIAGIIVFAFFALYIYNSSTNSITNAAGQISYEETLDMDMNSNFSSDIKSDGVDMSFDNFLGTSISNDKNEIQESAIEDPENSETAEAVEESVRNIFLESLAFIPELVTSNGKGETNIDLSDNITTWNIQAVGNTKDGRIGFNTSTFKVFKEFFIDFTLPTNSIVTDKTSIPVTIYNYTNSELSVNINVKENEWSTIGTYTKSINVLANSTKMVYIPLELLKSGNQTLRIESSANGVSDIVEKSFKINPNGFNKTKVVSSGSTEKDLTLDHFTTEKAIEGTRKLTVKLYPSVISQTVEGMENIFRMPTGCFEQTSSSLYPNILALKYLEDTDLDAPEIRETALQYISKGYQRLLTFETSQKGGYSLYGDDPAENVLTAFGLMELTDLQEVYEIDENITKNMAEYLFGEQSIKGTFDIGSTYIGEASSTDELAMNAYIIWALSEACPDDERLEVSVKYLEDKLEEATDNYTIALMANVFSNTDSSFLKPALNKLLEDVTEDGESAYIGSTVKDYWGSCGRYQDIQTTALASMVLTKERSNNTTNNAFIKYIIKNKDAYGTWSTTQNTVLALKAINTANSNSNISNQKIKIAVNGAEKEIEIKDNPLDLYELTFDNIKDENKISIDLKRGNIYYEIIEDYYVGYDMLEFTEALKSSQKLAVTQNMKNIAKVNDILEQTIDVTNLTNDMIRNGLVQIYIPQGCSVVEESLAKLVHDNYIEKYEYNYNTINLYFRNMQPGENINLNVQYRANYPEQITGGLVRVYDYYNPLTEGHAKPVNIVVTD